MRIGELAQRCNCEVETIRFYEQEGLLEVPAREANGYRNYTDLQLTHLKFIRHCRSLGMSLPDVRTLRRFQANPELACDDINQLIDSHIQRIHQQVESLRMLEQQLHALRDSCHSNQQIRECGILKNLEQASVGEACDCHPASPVSS